VKKASPSKGVIRADFDPEAIAAAYARAGAAALSVLTDVPHFQGSPAYLKIAREASGLPVLRKDFLYDPYQVLEARAWGADAVLLIVAALEDAQLRDLQAFAHELGMDALVEVHTAEETERALAAGCPLIGVNNRDLGDFRTSLEISDRLLPRIAPHALAVSESALETRADLDRVRAAGARAVLIGTTFCAAPDIEGKVREVMGR
jgi:indole-3-glycerol phosphate synthase